MIEHVWIARICFTVAFIIGLYIMYVVTSRVRSRRLKEFERDRGMLFSILGQSIVLVMASILSDLVLLLLIPQLLLLVLSCHQSVKADRVSGIFFALLIFTLHVWLTF